VAPADADPQAGSRTPARRPPFRRLVEGLAGWAFLITVISIVWDNPPVLTAMLVGASIATLVTERSRRTTLFWLAGAILGPSGESLCVHFGAWKYAATEFLIPFWLPPAWGLATLSLVMVVEAAGDLLGSDAAE